MNLGAGLGDPYFYEWTIGLDKITSMLIPEKEIKSVVLQATVDTLDDVVCEYERKIEYIQVKHTRANDKMGFAFLLGSDGKEDSLLKKIAKSWKKLEHESTKTCYAILLTNRKPVITATSISRKSKKISVPAFGEFLSWFQERNSTIQSLEFFKKSLPNEGWVPALEAWFEEINVFEDEKETLEFIRNFRIVIEHPDTLELDKEIMKKITDIFSVNQDVSLELYKSLFYSLKEWASSKRKQEKITVEEVCSSLAIKEERYPQHLLFPPIPFFESRKTLISYIEDFSQKISSKMLFLYGKPGIGKTSLVNFLANKPNTVVDLRYHAYVPITPDNPYVNLDYDDSINEEMLWGSLLNQVRELFRGRLFEYKIPIRNQFLSKEELRKTVLRLASEFGKIHNKNTVIVIDGIDHAARAGSKETFLRSLISPEMVPDNVFIILCGQPAEDYEEYPIWLRENFQDKGLEKVQLTGVTIEDIEVLLKEINPGIDDFSAASKIIYEISMGNTLSAIFAAYESKNIKNGTELLSFLNARSLSSNITEYYDAIWNSLDDRVLKNGYQIKELLAALFSITVEKISIDDLVEIFRDNPINRIQWRQILGFYSPLVIESEGKYTLYHNDIRVYLKNKLRMNSNIISYVAGMIANYYLSSPGKNKVKHRDIFRLLDLSNRNLEKIDVFSIKYIDEAIMLRQDMNSLLNQFQEVVKQSNIEYDFEKIKKIALTAIYLNQYQQIVDYYQGVKPSVEIPKLLHSEYEKINLNTISMTDVENVIEDITELLNDKQYHRARMLFGRWFGDLEATSTHLIANEARLQNQKLLSDEADVLIEIGYLSKVINHNISLEFLEEQSLIRKFITYGKMLGLAEKGSNLQFAKFFKENAHNIRYSQLEELLDNLFENQEWNKLLYILSKIKKSKDWSFDSLDIKIIFLKTILERKRISSCFYKDIKLLGFKAFREKDYHYKEKLKIYCSYSFVLGYIKDLESKKITMNEAVHEYYINYGDKRGLPHLQNLISISFELGNIFATKKYMNFDVFKGYLNFLFDECRTPFLTGIYEVAKQLCKFIIDFIENSNDSILQSDCTKFLLNRAQKREYQLSYSVTLTWEYLAERGYYVELEQWFNYWFGIEGECWDSSIEDLISTFQLFSELMLKYEINEEIVKRARERLFQNLLGFIEHKDDVLKYPHETLKRILEENPLYWSTKGLDLYNLSHLAEGKGDNLLASYIKKTFIEGAILSGPQEFQGLLDNEHFEKEIITEIQHIMNFFKENWRMLEFDEEDLLGLWCLIEATSNKISNSDVQNKIEFSNEIIENLSNGNKEFLKERTEELSQIEYENPFIKNNRKEDLSKYYELPIEELISEFLAEIEKLKYQSYAWERFKIVATRIGGHRTKEFIKYRDILFNFFINRENHYSWESDNASTAAESLIPLLSSNQKKEMYSDIVNNAFVLKNPSYWLSSFTEDVNNYVLYMIKADSPEKLVSYFDQQVSLVSSWYNIDFRQIELLHRKEETSSWVDIFRTILWSLFSTVNIERTMKSFNAIYYFLKIFTYKFDFEKLITFGSVKQKYFILLILEKLVREEQDISVAQTFLDYCLSESKLLNLRLQSSIVLAYRSKEVKQLNKLLYRNSEKKILTQAKSGILQVPSLIRRTEKLLDTDLSRTYLESYASYEIEYSQIKEINLQERALGFRDTDAEDFITQRVMNDELENLSYPVDLLCQMCLPMDEPDVILFTPAYCRELNNFGDEKLDEEIIFQNGMEVLNINIPEDEILIAGVISFYPPKENKVMAFSKKIVNPYYNSEREVGKTFGGRKFLNDLTVIESYSNKNTTLFDLTYGYCYFVNEQYKMTPSNFFGFIEKQLGKKIEIRFELFYGKGEELYRDMAAFRQPTMQRWIMKKKDVEELQKKIGIVLTEAQEILDI
ncbi:AAA family ATPase [Bacillus cereus]|uniref:AAA family ATPase n=1 Tax=Bacillus cereus TaxID=1396 RepID=UPI000BFA7C7C|nr:AAA family ATPase [Bacillus cereus]PFT36094.1 hypothetical protein COK71_09795 [Bacillus cereus]